MAEASSLPFDPKSISARYRNRPRKPQPRPSNVEEKSPKRVLPKRPPRRPKLPDGSALGPNPGPSASSQGQSASAGRELEMGQYYVMKEKILETGEQFSMLNLKEESFQDSCEAGSSSSTLVKVRESKKKRSLRKPKLPDGRLMVTSPESSPSKSKVTCADDEQKIENEETLSQFNLSQESFEDQSLVESCTSPCGNTDVNEPKKRRKRIKKKLNMADDENVAVNSDTVTENSSVSNIITDVSNAKVETVKNHFYLQNLQKNKKQSKFQKDAHEQNTQQGSSKKNSIRPTRKEMNEKKKKVKKVFNEHLPAVVVKKLLAVQDPDKPNIVEGCIRINPRCYQNSYISLTNGDQDILIIGLKDRNRALEGDLVAVVINCKEKWFKIGDDAYQKTGTVVSILEKAHPRKAVGFLKKQDVFVFLQPRDSRVPIMKINPRTVPKNFYDNPELFEETLFLCKIVDWKNVAFAEGEVEKIVGNKGDLKIETEAILLENDLILTPYPDELLTDLPPSDYIPTETDLIERDDLRKSCIFTIDPATAVDLDDAMSCKPLKNGNFEIGIHISDVTHFLQAFSPLDRVVAKRATTVYMVDNVYHMLPKQLCLVCSLLPGQDKLAFSVIVEVTPAGEVLNYRFCKSVINSCCQMSYEQAQIMIDNEDYDWEKNGSLKIYGDYTPADLTVVVRNLYRISKNLRQKRFDDGALKIDQAKLHVSLDEFGIPVSYKLEEKRESNSLIEEFMLLANMTVAKYLYENLPEISLLRSHAAPSQRILKKTQDLLTKFGVVLNVDSAGSLQNSLHNWYQSAGIVDSDSTEIAQYRWMVINSLCAKSMMRAVYKCSSEVKSPDDLKHYALNAEFYTHFTSPIRRYPDCIVHRLLYASIKSLPLPDEFTSSVCKSVAKNCNVKKYSAKMAQEQSNTLYFTYMLDLKGSMNVLAIVMDIKERSVDSMLCDTGLKVRLYFDDTLEETTVEYNVDKEVPTVKLTWKKRGIVQDINIFSILNVKITKHAQLFKLQGIILPPVQIETI